MQSSHSPPMPRGKRVDNNTLIPIRKRPRKRKTSIAKPEEFEVEDIVAMRFVGSSMAKQFMVKWQGYPSSLNTWEPLENLEGCQELLQEFLASWCRRIPTSPKFSGDDFPFDTTSPPTSPPPSSAASTTSSLSRSMSASRFSDLLVVPALNGATIQPQKQSSSAGFRKMFESIPKGAGRSTKSSRATTPSPKDPRSQEEIEAQAQSLKAFENLFKNSAGPSITVENKVDYVGCPPEFKYTADYIYGEGVPKPDLSISTNCHCAPGSCSITNGCACMAEAARVSENRALPFDSGGGVTKTATKLLWTCHEGCGCGPECVSGAPMRGRRYEFKITRFKLKGWGVVLNQENSIPPGTFIAKYTGEVITEEEADRRGMEYDKMGVTYLFDLDYDVEKDAPVYTVDATKWGNESRFFNHSCDPNMSVYMLSSGKHEGTPKMMTISFWSNRWILEGEELTFDYSGQYGQVQLEPEPSEPQEKGQQVKIHGGMSARCFCQSILCRTTIYA